MRRMASRRVAGVEVQDGPRSIRVWTREDVVSEDVPLMDAMVGILFCSLLASAVALKCS